MTSSEGDESFTIGQAAAMTGLSVSTLRAWEQRHGFPRPFRLSGGHRRYSLQEVDLVRRAAAEHQRGVGVATAISRVLDAMRRPKSLFAAMQSALPGVGPQRMPKPALVKVSRALEDEIAWRAADAVLVGGFQDRRFYQVQRDRWTQLAATSSLTVVLAEGLPKPCSDDRPVTVPLTTADLLAREWFLLCLSPTFAAGLVGWEAPGDRRAGRSFEVLWTLEPEPVTAAMRVVQSLVEGADVEVGCGLRDRVEQTLPRPLETSTVLAVARRIVDYLVAPD